MAYTGSPYVSTYSVDNIPLVNDLEIRPTSDLFFNSAASGVTSISQGAGLVNIVPYKKKGQQELCGYTRPAIHATSVNNETGTVYGTYVWTKNTSEFYLFVVTGAKVYTSTDGVNWVLRLTLGSTPASKVGFTEHISDVGTKTLVMVTGAEGYVWSDGITYTKITDADFPAPHIPDVVFIDGYVFVAKSSTGDIYNCDLNTPLVWTAGSFISSELYPDDVVALTKINNYLLAIGTTGCEYFYDAANPTASPLARVESASLAFGCMIPKSIAVNKNSVTMICSTNDGGGVIRVIEDMKFTDVPSGTILPYLNTQLGGLHGASATDYTLVSGFNLRINDDLLYCLNFKSNTSPQPLYLPTLAFSFNTGMWVEFRYDTTPLPVSFSTWTDPKSITNYVCGNSSTKVFFGTVDESVYGAESYVAYDYLDGVGSGVAIPQEVRTPNQMFETLNIKTMAKVGIDVNSLNKAITSTASDYVLSLSYTDDDYRTFSTPISLQMQNSSSVDYWPFVTQLGKFRRRAFKITYAGKLFWKWNSLETHINKGVI